jgi:hypothetical protein
MAADEDRTAKHNRTQRAVFISKDVSYVQGFLDGFLSDDDPNRKQLRKRLLNIEKLANSMAEDDDETDPSGS